METASSQFVPGPPNAAPASRPPILTRVFLLLVGGHFLAALGNSSMLLLPLYLDWLGGNRATVGAIMSSAALGGLLTRPFVGWALDRFGRRPTLFAGIAVLALGIALLGLVDRIGPLAYAARAIAGIGVGVCFTGYFTFVTDIVPEERRTEGIALFGISGLVPLAVNPLAGSIGLDAPELRWFFPISGAAVLASLALLALVREHRPAEDREAFRLRRILAVLVARPIWPVWLSTVLFAGVMAVFLSFASVTAEARGFGEPAAIWLTYAIGAIGVRLFGSGLPDRLGPSRILGPAVATYCAGVLLAAVATTQAQFVAAGALTGLGHGFCFPVLASQMTSRTPRSLRGAVVAAFTSVWDLAALLFVPLFGWVADTTSDGIMLAIAALIPVAGLAVWAPLERSAARP